MVNWLVIGVGDITRKRVLPAILAEPRSRLVGIVTRDPAKAAPYGVPGYTKLETALAESGCTAVYVATPVALHKEQTIAALRANQDVLCEKPTAMNLAEAEQMLRAAQECGRLLGVAYYRRMYAKVARAKQLLEAGAIGQPVWAEATSHSWFPEDAAAGEWRADPAMAGGGPLYDIASHRIDLMNYFFGRPLRVFGQTGNAVFRYGRQAQPLGTAATPTLEKDSVEDNATVMVEYGGGVRGVVDVRWHSTVARDEFRIRGTHGELELSPLNDAPLITPTGAESVPAPQNLHLPCVEDFVTSVLTRTAYRCNINEAIWTDWVTEQVMRQNRTSDAESLYNR